MPFDDDVADIDVEKSIGGTHNSRTAMLRRADGLGMIIVYRKQ